MNGPLTSGAYVTTAEVQGGATDAVLLVYSNLDPSHAVAFDDEANRRQCMPMRPGDLAGLDHLDAH